ncbi:MAG: ATP-binding protein, partial [Nitrospiria bacterium]
GGPRGWIAQQGFYIYRNNRIILAGDWLRLGRGSPWAKEEQYKLARISVDIPNSLDFDWSLDVKKSTARPPAILRGRLIWLAERVRSDARKVFTHRGQYGPRPINPSIVAEKTWDAKKRGDHIIYKINRKHPLIESMLKRLGPLAEFVEPILRLAEETVPVQRIWLDTAESESDHAIPYEGLDEAEILNDMRQTYKFLIQKIQDPNNALAFLLATEPFNRYPHLANKMVKEE